MIDTDDTDRRLIPEFSAIEFGDGYIEAHTEPVFETAHDLATVLKGLGVLDAKFEGQVSNGHCVAPMALGAVRNESQRCCAGLTNSAAARLFAEHGFTLRFQQPQPDIQTRCNGDNRGGDFPNRIHRVTLTADSSPAMAGSE